MSALTGVEAAVVDAVDPAEVVEDLATMVTFPSVGGHEAECDVQAWLARRLWGLGLDVDHWQLDLPTLRIDPEYPGEEVDRSEAWGCVGVLGAEAPDGSPAAGGGDGSQVPALVLSGHTDVVPPGATGSWHGRDPWTLLEQGGELWGRGACDMKAGVAAIIGAVAALRRAGVRVRRPLAVHSVVGEEDGGVGAFATLQRGHTGEVCLIAEPTTGAMVVANSGALTFRLEVDGVAAHGAMRTRGVSAVERLLPLLGAFSELEAARNVDPPPEFAHLDLMAPLSVGMVRAGDWASTVPDLVVAEGRYGVLPGESVEDARAAFTDCLDAACARDPWLSEHPARLAWVGGQFASGSLPAGHDLAARTATALADVGVGTVRPLGAAYGSDLRQYAAAGIATLQYGPGNFAQAHSADEHVRGDDVVRAARAYALLVLRSCGVAA